MCSSVAAVVSAGIAVVEFVFHYMDRKRRKDAVDADRTLDALEACVEDERLKAKDLTYYTINGEGKYQKNRLVLEVIRKYVQEREHISYEELQLVFPKTIRGLKREDSFWGCFNLEKDATKLFCDTGHRRHFLDPSELIHLGDGQVIAVSTQWGRGNIENFIGRARELGFRIDVLSTEKNH